MSSWNDALYDTCSLVTLGKVLLDHPGARPGFASVWAIEASLSPARMRPRTAACLRATVRLCDLPSLAELTAILAAACLPPAVAEVDRLTYAAAVHHRHRVVTADKNLARALAKAKIGVGSPDLVLEGLIKVGSVTEAARA